MYAYLEGQIEDKTAEFLVLDVGGIGYRIAAAPGMLDRLGTAGEQKRIYTYLIVRDDAVTLYGFSNHEEQTLFEMLLTVSGVGPKVASGIVADLAPDLFALAVITEDTAVLTRIKGIGKKGAQRIILELKDKLGDRFPARTAPEVQGESRPMSNGVRGDAIHALMVLGYTEIQATRAVDHVFASDSPLEQVIKAALSQLVR